MTFASDPIDTLLDDWRRLSSADRRAVRARLSPAERKRLDKALATPAPASAKRAEPKPRPIAELFAECSPQLAKRLSLLAEPDDEAGATEATRAAVRAIVAERRVKRS